jgi:hypothetical protein
MHPEGILLIRRPASPFRLKAGLLPRSPALLKHEAVHASEAAFDSLDIANKNNAGTCPALFFGSASGGNRTPNRWLKRPLLYR